MHCVSNRRNCSCIFLTYMSVFRNIVPPLPPPPRKESTRELSSTCSGTGTLNSYTTGVQTVNGQRHLRCRDACQRKCMPGEQHPYTAVVDYLVTSQHLYLTTSASGVLGCRSGLHTVARVPMLYSLRTR